MPLSGSESGIIGRMKAFSERRVGLWNLLAFAVNMEQRPPGVEHRAAWHADSPAGSSWYVRMREGCPAVNERIKIRGVDLVVPQFANGVITLIVGEEEQDVRFVTHLVLPILEVRGHRGDRHRNRLLSAMPDDMRSLRFQPDDVHRFRKKI